MKLEYLYNNNNNLKHTMKIIPIGFLITVMFTILINSFYNTDISLLLKVIIVSAIFCEIFYYVIITLSNNYKRKQFINITNNGIYFEGNILKANYNHKHSRKYSWLEKSAGNITVRIENKTYKITDIDYNSDFKNLKQKLEENFSINEKNFRQIKIGIYVFNNKAVADLNSIKYN